VPNRDGPDLSLFLGILHTLEAIDAPYMVIGAFAGTVYGVTRVTYDIDIVVDLGEEHIDALVSAYPPPRYYADPEQMRDSIRVGIMFNIIDTERGEKADLIPLTMASRYRQGFDRRLRQMIDIPGMEPFDIWCARSEDVVLGKLMAWSEGRSHKHISDIYEMLVFQCLGVDRSPGVDLDEAYVDIQVRSLGADVVQLWERLKAQARQQAAQGPGEGER
jgi:hypothetical protein